MKLEIYVVKTEIQPTNPLKAIAQYSQNKKRLKALNFIKSALIVDYNGLSVMSNFKGYWINENKLYTDKGEIWQLLQDSELTEKQLKRLKFLALQIRAITNQKTQLYTVNDKPIFL